MTSLTSTRIGVNGLENLRGKQFVDVLQTRLQILSFHVVISQKEYQNEKRKGCAEITPGALAMTSTTRRKTPFKENIKHLPNWKILENSGSCRFESLLATARNKTKEI